MMYGNTSAENQENEDNFVLKNDKIFSSVDVNLNLLKLNIIL